VTMHDGNTGKPRTLINIEKAAKWCADSNGKPYCWKPYERAAVRGYSPEAIVVLPTMPVDDDTAAA